MKKTIITVAVIAIAIIAIYLLGRKPAQVPPTDQNASQSADTNASSSNATTKNGQTGTVSKGPVETIGKSAGGNDIVAYHFGSGAKEVLLIGGIHGGYEWNTVLLVNKVKDYLNSNATAIPEGVKVTVIPVMNPDGLAKVVGATTGDFTASDIPDSQAIVVSGRYNGNTVDLNRNFDCDWQKTGVWQNTKVSGGTSAFSEPESQAIKTYVETNKPAAVVVWYSAAGGVYASNCHSGVLPVTDALVKAFAKASGYPANESFDYYATTGDMANWLARIGTPAISILLTNHSDTELSKNIAGLKALLNYYK